MVLSRLTTVGALATALVLPAAIGVAPAHAANFTAVYNTGTGFGAQVLSANSGDTITITNNTPLTVAFIFWACAQSSVAGPGSRVTFTMCAGSGFVVAVGPGAQPALVVT